MALEPSPQHIVDAIGRQRDINANEWAKAEARAAALEQALAVSRQANDEQTKLIAELRAKLDGTPVDGAPAPANDRE
jgi:hypothetical protein